MSTKAIPSSRAYLSSCWGCAFGLIEIYHVAVLTEGIFIRCHPVLNKCGLWCSLISACSTCSIWAPFAGSLPRRLLKEPLHLCQGQVEICCILLIGQSAFQTPRHHTHTHTSDYHTNQVSTEVSHLPSPLCCLLCLLSSCFIYIFLLLCHFTSPELPRGLRT